jgi:hypothetical protein
MSHPTLPPEQTITVADSAVSHWEGIGWVLETSVDTGGETPAEPETTDQADAPDAPKE